MTRVLMAVPICCGVLLTTWALAQEPPPPADKDEPPLRLKKKPLPDDPKPDQPKEPKKPAAEGRKPDDAAKEPVPAEPQEDEKEVLGRVSKNMRSLEERLANKELGDGTRQVGDDIMKDLESLIRSMDNPPAGGGGGGDAQNDPSGSSNDQKNKGGSGGQSSPSGGRKSSRQKNQSGGSGSPQQQPGGRKNGSGSPQQQPGGGNQPMPDKQAGQNPMGGTPGERNSQPSGTSQPNGKGGNGGKDDELNHNADLYKDIWGHLPEAMRAEMNAYSTDKEMIPKYDALIKKVSRTIAEQSSRKDK